MSQGEADLLRQAQALEEQATAFYAQARQATADEFLAATFHFLETQRLLARQQLEDEALRLGLALLPPAEGAA